MQVDQRCINSSWNRVESSGGLSKKGGFGLREFEEERTAVVAGCGEEVVRVVVAADEDEAVVVGEARRDVL